MMFDYLRGYQESEEFVDLFSDFSLPKEMVGRYMLIQQGEYVHTVYVPQMVNYNGNILIAGAYIEKKLKGDMNHAIICVREGIDQGDSFYLFRK